eukprot:364788-Chlamydomonas_euryale.AAC.11
MSASSSARRRDASSSFHSSTGAGMYLLQHWMLNQPHKYWQSLRQLLLHARAAGDERPLNNAYLQIESMMAAEDLADQPGGGVEDAPAHALPLREGRMA